MRDTRDIMEGAPVLITLSDGRTTHRERGVFVKKITDGLTMNGEKEDTCLVLPTGCTQTVVVRLASIKPIET